MPMTEFTPLVDAAHYEQEVDHRNIQGTSPISLCIDYCVMGYEIAELWLEDVYLRAP